MRILFLDDSVDRQRLFLSRHPQAVQTWTAAETIRHLTPEHPWDLVCLDHDLGGEIMVSSDREDTGAAVVRHMVQQPLPVALVLVHSFNEVAAARMVSDLKRAGYDAAYTPFGSVLLQAIASFQRE